MTFIKFKSIQRKPFEEIRKWNSIEQLRHKLVQMACTSLFVSPFEYKGNLQILMTTHCIHKERERYRKNGGVGIFVGESLSSYYFWIKVFTL